MRFFQMSDRTTEQNSAGGTVSQPYGPRSGSHGSDGWAMTPSGMRGVLNDAVSLYFADTTLASAFGRSIPGTRRRGFGRACIKRRKYPDHNGFF
jgi:hypothetical protein